MKNTVWFLIATVWLVACASNSSRPSDDDQRRSEASQALAALATTSALLVALPMIPFVEAYDWLNDTDAKRRAKARAIAAHFDPIYADRVRRIRARSPQADADDIADRGRAVLLPSVPDGIVYPGLAQRRWSQVDHEANAERIAADPLASDLLTLMAKPPSHDREVTLNYSGQPYRDFVDSYFAYKKSFNIRMLERCEQKLPLECVQ